MRWNPVPSLLVPRPSSLVPRPSRSSYLAPSSPNYPHIPMKTRYLLVASVVVAFAILLAGALYFALGSAAA